MDENNMADLVQNQEIQNKKMIAGILAILLGYLGIHKFYLGYTLAGVIMLLVTLLTFGILATAIWIISIIEGVIYLTKSNDQFKRDYIDGKRTWF